MPTYNLNHATLDALRAAGNAAADLKLPGRASYALAKNLQAFAPHLRDYDAKVQQIVQEFAAKDEEGNPQFIPVEGGRVSFKIDPDRRVEFVERRQELDDFVCEGIVLHLVPEAVFENFMGDLSPRDLGLVAWMVEGLTTLKPE